jgi:SAM-dependent methyltransferase
MTVSIDATAKKYRGRKAETYEAIRTKQERWTIENTEVRRMLKKLRPISVLDMPVGTGRFLSLYDTLDVKRVIGVDVSDAMLLRAADKAKRCKNRKSITLVCKDVRKMKIGVSDVTVCVRFLDLIDENAMRIVITKLLKLTTRAIICTIRFGPVYIPKSNTAEHDEQKFRALLNQYGWKVARAVPVFKQGWHVLLLKPK